MSEEIAARHAKEIDDIVMASHQRVVDGKLDGKPLLAERQACTKALREACDRHREELNKLSSDRRVSEAAAYAENVATDNERAASEAAKRQPKPVEPAAEKY